MKIHGENLSAQTSGVTQTGQFNIKATGKAFKILSDGLYSDKPLAVVRELSCNAWDAHIAADKRDVPFEVCLPTTLSPLFYVKDFGIGLSHDDVMVLFTTFFDSTKTESNDFVGALGLGSKSPFSYVDQFNVTSRFDGQVRKYTAFIGDGGFPSIALLSEDGTDECNGLEVSMPIKSGDVLTFCNAAQKVLPHFDTKPIVKGCSTITLDQKVLLRGTGWTMIERDPNHNRYSRTECLKARMGAVCYPLTSTGVTEPGLADMVFFPFIVDFPLGSLDVAASREALSYDAATVKAIKERLTEVKHEVTDVLVKDMDAATSLWEAHILFGKTIEQSGLVAMLPKGHTINWKAKDGYFHTIGMDGIKIDANVMTGTDVRSTYRHPFNPRHLADTQSIVPRDNVRIYCVDEKTGWGGKITYQEAQLKQASYPSHTTNATHKPQVLVITGDYRKVIAHLGSPPHTMTSTLITDPSIVSQTVTTGPDKVKVKLSKVWHAVPGSGNFTEPDTAPDLSVKRLVAAMWRGSPTREGTQAGVMAKHQFAQMTKLAQDAGIIPAENIMGIPASYRELVKKTAWVDVFEHIEEALKKEVFKKRKKLWRWCLFQNRSSIQSAFLLRLLPDIIDRGVDLTEVNRLNASCKSINTLTDKDRGELSALVRLCTTLGKEDLLGWTPGHETELFPILARKGTRLLNMFPLLKWAGYKEANPDIVEYVCSIHAAHKTHASEVSEDNQDFGHTADVAPKELP